MMPLGDVASLNMSVDPTNRLNLSSQTILDPGPSIPAPGVAGTDS